MTVQTLCPLSAELRPLHPELRTFTARSPTSAFDPKPTKRSGLDSPLSGHSGRKP